MDSSRRSDLIGQQIVTAAALGLAYFVVAALTLRFTRFDGGVAFIWAAGPILLSALMLNDRRRWPVLSAVCVIAGAAASSLYGLGPAAALPMALINVGEALVAAAMLRRWCPQCGAFRSIGEIAMFLLTAGGLVPAASAFAGAFVAGHFSHVPYATSWLTWFTAHALGTAIVAPLVLLSLGGDIGGWVRGATVWQRIEALVLLAVLAIVATAVFVQTTLPLLFLPFLPMMIAVFRLGRMGAAASTVILTAIGAYCTIRGTGPVALIVGDSGVHTQFLQLYLATGVLMALPAAGDLRRRQQTLTDVQEQSALQRLILDRTGDVIMTLEPDGRIRYVSPSAERIIGRDPTTLIGTMPHDLIHAEDVGAVVAVHRQALGAPDRTFIVEYRVVAGGRALGWFETHTRAIVDDQNVPTGVVSIIRDVTQRKATETLLTIDATTDPLTGLGNRRALDRALGETLARGIAGAVAIFDLDHFKRVNDRHGHAAGDTAIRAFADLLHASVRDEDTVARIGGEEFVALLPGANPEAAAAVCERVRHRLSILDIPVGEESAIRITVSGGIAAFTADRTAAEIMAAADAALYRSKLAGRNRLSLAA